MELRDIRDALGRTREMLDELSGSGPGAAPRDAIKAMIDAFVASITAINVPGSHGDGLSNQELFDILYEQGRPFLEVNRYLRDDIRISLYQEYLDDSTVPTRRELLTVAKLAAIERIQARMEGRSRDVRIKALSPEYRKRKFREGYRLPPGIRTRSLFNSLLRLEIVT